jgi:uncharacterized phiE125 gp8 family phage protein
MSAPHCVYGLEITNPDDAVTEPVTLAEAKDHLNIEESNTASDTRVTALITTARQMAERETKRQIVPKDLRLSLTGFPDEIWLPSGIVRAVTAITYRDSGGTWRTLSSSVYEVLTQFSPARVVLAPNQFWPSVGTGAVVVRVDYTAGWADADAIPQTLKQAMLLMIGNWHYQRGDDAKAGMSDVPPGAERLLAMWTLPQYE